MLSNQNVTIMVEITEGHLINLKVDMNDAFMGATTREQVTLSYDLIVPPSEPQNVILYLTYFQSTSSIEGDDFVFKLQSVWEYKLSPKLNITPKDVYECVVKTQKHMQEISSAIFSKQKSFIEIRIPAFEHEVDEISSSLQRMIE